jgi:trk system potassium uptake protein TrkH
MLLRTFIFDSPGRTLFLCIITVIAIGTGLLMMPAAQTSPHTFLDLVFTATSATSVTGLLTTNLNTFSLFGQWVILLLMQVGWLGLITFLVFFVSLFVRVGMKTHLMAGQLLEVDSWKSTRSIIAFIIGLSVITEGLGTIFLYHALPIESKSWFLALFQSVSAFCSAGFTLFDNNVIGFAHNIYVLIVFGLLIAIGELGFITWSELIDYLRSRFSGDMFRLSLHSKIVLIKTGILLTGTSILIWLIQYVHTDTSIVFELSNSVFNAIAYRSSGFTTIPIADMHEATYFLIMIISFIGSAPGSTGSGIKLTSFALFLATIRSVVSGRGVIEIKGRRIPNDQIFKALAVLSLSLTWIAMTTFSLLISQKHWGFVDCMFEAFSAFSNLGLTIGGTQSLNTAGKCIIMASMILGRLGPLTLILSIKARKDNKEFRYPEERIMLS